MARSARSARAIGPSAKRVQRAAPAPVWAKTTPAVDATRPGSRADNPRIGAVAALGNWEYEGLAGRGDGRNTRLQRPYRAPVAGDEIAHRGVCTTNRMAPESAGYAAPWEGNGTEPHDRPSDRAFDERERSLPPSQGRVRSPSCGYVGSRSGSARQPRLCSDESTLPKNRTASVPNPSPCATSTGLITFW